MTSAVVCANPTSVRLQRILFMLAGTVTLAGLALAVVISPWFLFLPVLTGANQLLFAAVGWCPMSLLLTRIGVGNPIPTAN